MVESTPLLVDLMGKNGGGPSFSMAPTPKRESLAKELGEKASQSLRKRNAAMNHGSASVSASTSILTNRTPTGATPGMTPGGVFKKPLARHQSPALEALKKKLAGKAMGQSVLGGAFQNAHTTPSTRGMNPTPTRSWTGSQSGQPISTPSESFSLTPLHNVKKSGSRISVGSTSSIPADRSKITDNLLNLKP
jgi:hypothetical protein